MPHSGIDWNALERLRTGFLNGSAGKSDYWNSIEDLASYDQTYAQRIGWKWDYVLAELRNLQWAPPPGALLDWGCGSGIAHRAFFESFGLSGISHLMLLDRSKLALKFSSQRLVKKYPRLPTSDFSETPGTFSTLLVSHVLTELNEAQLQNLLSLATQAICVLWVEPGTHETSRRLISIRESLRSNFKVVAPCPHQQTCRMLQPDNHHHWCHFFASPPPFVFTDSEWGKFSAVSGIDLRSLPVSYLALDRRSVPAQQENAVRVIGHPRIYKPHALLLGCREAALNECRLTKRRLPDLYRALKKESASSLQTWQCQEDEIVAANFLNTQQS